MAPHTPPGLRQTGAAGGSVRAVTGTGAQLTGHIGLGKHSSPDTGDICGEPDTGGVSETLGAGDVIITVLTLL